MAFLMALKKIKKRFLNLQVSVAEPEIHFRRNSSSQIMFSAPCTMCQAFVWHLLLARQTNLKILGGGKIKKIRQERFWDSLYPCSGLCPGWNDSAFVLGGSVSPEHSKDAFPMLFPGLILTWAPSDSGERRSRPCFALGRWMKASRREAGI